MILSTQGTDSSAYRLTLPVSFAPETVAMDVMGCRNYTVNGRGEISADMDRGEPLVLYPASMIGGSEMCGYEDINGSTVDMETGGNSTKIPGASAMGLSSSLGDLIVSLMTGILMLLL